MGGVEKTLEISFDFGFLRWSNRGDGFGNRGGDNWQRISWRKDVFEFFAPPFLRNFYDFVTVLVFAKKGG